MSGKAVRAAPAPTLETRLIEQAEALILKGRDQGWLSPEEVVQGFPDLEAEPDQLPRIFQAFKEMGIEVSETGHELEDPEDADDDIAVGLEVMDVASLDDPVRMYLKEIGRVSLLTAAD